MSRAKLLRRPLPGRPGKLKLIDGRLKFSGPAEASFEHPVGELHSLRGRRRGFDVSCGDRRYRVEVAPASSPDVNGEEIGRRVNDPDLLDAVSGLVDWLTTRDSRRQAKQERHRWVEVLGPLVGDAPRP